MKNINSLNEIISSYDTFLLDQWGVIHNGGDAFPKAVETLKALKDNNKKVVILSNSGKTRASSYQRLEDSGVSRDLYIDVMTSGDHMRHAFASKRFDKLGNKPAFFSWDNDFSILDELNFNNTDINNASFVLCCGVDRGYADAYTTDLEIAIKNGLELVVSNPDLYAMNPDGELKECPGKIAQKYVDMGGIVHWFGTPQAEMYELCRDMVNGWENAVAVGDSLEHDIAGANNFGISSVLIKTGIHADDFKNNSVESVAKKYNVAPTYAIDWFEV